MTTPDAGRHYGEVRTFHARRGRVTSRQATAIARSNGSLLLPVTDRTVDAERVFGRIAPLVLEIGFGMGDATVELAKAQPDLDVLAVDVHTRGIGTVLDALLRAELRNVRVIAGDAVPVVERMLAPGMLAEARIFFPDPWPKARHRKRRLLQPSFVHLLAGRLVTGGRLHVATDDDDYAEQVLAVVRAEPRLHNPHDGPAPRPATRPMTRFERRGIRAGHRVHDIIATRTLTP